MSNIDVIIPLKNGAEWIETTLRSVRAQTVPPEQVIVVDDGSTDNSVEKVRRCDGVRLLTSSTSGSAAAARNTGLREAQSDFVAFLDQDDVWHRDHLKHLRQILMDYPAVPAAASLYRDFTDEKNILFDFSNLKIQMIDPWEGFPFIGHYQPSVVLYRRSAFLEEGWPVGKNGFADYMVWLMLGLNRPLMRLHAHTVGRRRHENSFYSRMQKQPLQIIDQWQRVLGELLRHRGSALPDDKQVGLFKKRAQVVGCFFQLLTAVEKRDAQSAGSSLKRWAALAGPEDNIFTDQAFAQLAYYLRLLSQQTGGALLDSFRWLHACCPVQSEIIKERIGRWMLSKRPGINFFLGYCARNPFDVSRRRLLQKYVAESERLPQIISSTPHLPQEHIRFELAWGGQGRRDDEFLHPEFICFDRQGRVLVSDPEQVWIKVFSPDGQFITKFGGPGEEEHNFVEPEGLAIGPGGDIFVADSTTGLIKKFTEDYQHLLTFSGFGHAPGLTNHSEAMCIAPNKLLYIADANNHRISVFDLEGNFRHTIGEIGYAPGCFNSPQTAKADSQGLIWTTDMFNHRLQVFSPEGLLIRTIGSRGKGAMQFQFPSGLGLDKFDNVYVCDMGNHRIVVFDKYDHFLYSFGRAGRGPGEFDFILDAQVSPQGFLFVTDADNYRVQKFRLMNMEPSRKK